ncbi:MAG: DUF3307 domain-containing protein [Flavobacteriaceae bacterium]|jgi:hypothetical protein|nr:DUF3307 domain-containing protein [Flavobacteriaceae bacterium]
MQLFILKILLAHLAGDFVFQPKKWVEDRSKNGYKSVYLYLHIAVHFLLLILLFAAELQAVFSYILLIVLSHFLIDLGKIYLERTNRFSTLTLFITDQLLHFSVLTGVVFWRFSEVSFLSVISVEKLLLYIIALLLITSVTSIAMKLFFSKWNESFKKKTQRKESLKNAGNIIGITERLLVVLFINIGFFEGIGYLLAAKSIFRFGDLTNAKDRKLTEYILSGTLISFAVAIIVGIALRYALMSL